MGGSADHSKPYPLHSAVYVVCECRNRVPQYQISLSPAELGTVSEQPENDEYEAAQYRTERSHCGVYALFSRSGPSTCASDSRSTV